MLEIIRSGIHVTWVAPIISSNGADSEFRELLPELKGSIVKWGGV